MARAAAEVRFGPGTKITFPTEGGNGRTCHRGAQGVFPRIDVIKAEPTSDPHPSSRGSGRRKTCGHERGIRDSDVRSSPNVPEILWHKLITNCAYNALSAVAQLPYGPMVEVEGARDVMRNAVEECAAVARACGVAVPHDIHERVSAVARNMPGQSSSTAQDLARGKRTEIDYLNGYVVRKGASLGISTPTNLALQVMVKLRERSLGSRGAGTHIMVLLSQRQKIRVPYRHLLEVRGIGADPDEDRGKESDDARLFGKRRRIARHSKPQQSGSFGRESRLQRGKSRTAERARASQRS